MYQTIRNILGWPAADGYRRSSPLILVNGLAEQGESWYPNHRVWQQQFDVHAPGVIVYGGQVMQDRLKTREPIDINFLTDRLTQYLDQYVQAPPYNLVASSLGGQLSIEYAARYPEKVDKIVLLCPSGFGTEEKLPITEGARHKNYQGLVESTFHNRRLASPRIVEYYAEKFANKPWRKAFFETVRGTKSHSVKDKLSLVKCPTLVICGREDRIVDPLAVEEAVKDLPNYQFVMVPNCGHAPQLEFSGLINRMVSNFLRVGVGGV
ncbi:alpha/beta fold hydrolase [Anatilimnocola floriformis]|uniref:alpha/beta fold hydrolase n=1 Tax=Anatilimnocola floriformis TaxID=2948575 RepID=UPI0020C4F370|nr:alpha/beta hydrolase [Anatilimnocola floriformis]